LKTRLEAYRRQTSPLIDYYRDKGILRGVDGMAPIDDVNAAINWIFQKAEPKSDNETTFATPAGPKVSLKKSPNKTAKLRGGTKTARKTGRAEADAAKTPRKTTKKSAGKGTRKTSKKAKGKPRTQTVRAGAKPSRKAGKRR
jgi:adenylate kinase